MISSALIVLATVVMGTISLIVSIFDSSGRLQHRVAQRWARILLTLGRVRARAVGLERIPPGGSCVFVSNHLSYMDTPLVLALIPVEFRFMAKKSLFRVPFIGYHLKRAGHIPVDRENARAALRSMSDAAQIVRERGISVLVFPEGGRVPEGQMRDFKDGAAYIAIKAGVPVVPVGIVGTREILPMGGLCVRGGPAELRIGEPIPTAGLRLRSHAELTKELQERVRELTR
jgi:1-acyl-sn-glycerol-3-phosphate acyltransferase